MCILNGHKNNQILLYYCQGVSTLGLMSMVPIMPLYLAQLGSGYSPVWASIALAAPAITTIFLAGRIGRACDKYGYRVMVLISLAGFTLSMILMALSNDIHGFLFGRLLLGVCSLSITLTAFACAATQNNQRGKTLGLLSSASAFGCLVGPIVGGVLLDFWSLRPLLIATAIFSGTAALLIAAALKEPSQRQCDLPQQRHRENTCTWLMALRDPILRYWAACACLSQAAAFALVNVFVLYLMTTRSSLPLASTVGVLHAGGWAANMLFSPWWGKANDAKDPRRNFAMAASGCAITIAILPAVDSIWQIVALRILQGACFSALAQSVFYSISRTLSAEGPGAGIGVAKRYLVLGQIIGPAMVAVLMIWFDARAMLYWIAGTFFLAAMVAELIPEAQRSFQEQQKKSHYIP